MTGTFTWSSVMGYIIVVVGKVTKHTINRRKGKERGKKRKKRRKKKFVMATI